MNSDKGRIQRTVTRTITMIFYLGLWAVAFVMSDIADFFHSKGESECCLEKTTHYVLVTNIVFLVGLILILGRRGRRNPDSE